MKVAIFSTRAYDRRFIEEANEVAGAPHRLVFHEAALGPHTTALAANAGAVCAFVNDSLDRPTLEALAGHGVRLVALRSAGSNHVDLAAAREVGIAVAHVPAYSPQAVAEHAVALMLALNRKTHRAYNRVREGNFALEGLLGFDMRNKCVGIIGTGQIGLATTRILQGFGCRVIGFDPGRPPEFEALGGAYVELDALYEQAAIISLHCPLNEATFHLVDAAAIERMREGVMLINTSRGAVVETRAIIAGLKSGRIGHLGLDVYEEEQGLFFHDASEEVLQDDLFARLLTFPNVLITGHQGFFTREAMQAIAETTVRNITTFEESGAPAHEVRMPQA